MNLILQETLNIITVDLLPGYLSIEYLTNVDTSLNLETETYILLLY